MKRLIVLIALVAGVILAGAFQPAVQADYCLEFTYNASCSGATVCTANAGGPTRITGCCWYRNAGGNLVCKTVLLPF